MVLPRYRKSSSLWTGVFCVSPAQALMHMVVASSITRNSILVGQGFSECKVTSEVELPGSVGLDKIILAEPSRKPEEFTKIEVYTKPEVEVFKV